MRPIIGRVVYTAIDVSAHPRWRARGHCSAHGLCHRARKEPIIGKQRTTFNKQARERANKAKAAAKRERRADRAAEKADGTSDDDDMPRESAAELMQALQDLHASYDNKQLTLEDFEEQRDDLVIRLSNAIA